MLFRRNEDPIPAPRLLHKWALRLGMLLLAGWVALQAARDPGTQMMFGSIVDSATLFKKGIISAQGTEERAEIVAEIPDSWRITYAGDTAAGNPTTITAFIDPLCSHCQQMVEDVPELNRRGITVEFIIAPFLEENRMFVGDLVSCSPPDQQKQALETVAAGETWPAPSGECNNEERYTLIADSILSQWNVENRPYVVLENGVAITGGLNPDTLERAIADTADQGS